MSRPSLPHRLERLEVTIVFEPYRLQDHLLQTAYAALVSLPRRRLAPATTPPATAPVQLLPGGARSAS